MIRSRNRYHRRRHNNPEGLDSHLIRAVSFYLENQVSTAKTMKEFRERLKRLVNSETFWGNLEKWKKLSKELKGIVEELY